MPVTSGSFHQSGETKCVRLGPSGVYDHPIIAGDLTLQIQLPSYPIDRGMKEEDGLGEPLPELGPVIPATKVGELVKKDLIEVRFRQLLRESGR